MEAQRVKRWLGFGVFNVELIPFLLQRWRRTTVRRSSAGPNKNETSAPGGRFEHFRGGHVGF
jgi:hypothetical protein